MSVEKMIVDYGYITDAGEDDDAVSDELGEIESKMICLWVCTRVFINPDEMFQVNKDGLDEMSESNKDVRQVEIKAIGHSHYIIYR